MSTVNVMELRRILAEYYLFHQIKFFNGIWREEKETMESIWLAIFLRGESILYREESPVHVTVSAIVLSSDHRHVLLNFHKKHNRWKHFGGHLEKSDRSFAEAAMREVNEETGLRTKNFIYSPVSQVGDCFDRPLDVHVIGGDIASTCSEDHVDLDIRYLFITKNRPEPAASEESKEVRWVPIDEVMDLVTADDPCNIERLLLKARSMGGDWNPEFHRRMFGTDPDEASRFFGK